MKATRFLVNTQKEVDTALTTGITSGVNFPKTKLSNSTQQSSKH